MSGIKTPSGNYNTGTFEALRGWLENSLVLNNVKIYMIVELYKTFLRIIKMKSLKVKLHLQTA